jgi:hypothetical protein
MVSGREKISGPCSIEVRRNQKKIQQVGGTNSDPYKI